MTGCSTVSHTTDERVYFLQLLVLCNSSKQLGIFPSFYFFWKRHVWLSGLGLVVWFVLLGVFFGGGWWCSFWFGVCFIWCFVFLIYDASFISQSLDVCPKFLSAGQSIYVLCQVRVGLAASEKTGALY